MSYQITEPIPSVPSTNFVHGGRGGLGNYRRVNPNRRSATAAGTESPINSRPASIGSIKSTDVYSCGRGGAGNMYAAGTERAMFSFDEELTRERVREDGAAPVYHVGRGGAGNFAKRNSNASTASAVVATEDGASRHSRESVRSGFEQVWGKISSTFSRS